MQVKVNCKKKPLDFSSGDFRSAIRSRYVAKKTVDAELTIADNGTMLINTGSQIFEISPDNTSRLSFFVDGDRTYIEAVSYIRGKETSVVIAPVDDNLTLWQDGVVNLRMAIDPLANGAGIEVNEIIDPNPIGLCPDGIDNMDSLIEERTIEGADILYRGQDEEDTEQQPVTDTAVDSVLYEDSELDIDDETMLEDMGELSDLEDMLDELDEFDDVFVNDETLEPIPYAPGTANSDEYDFLYDAEAYVEPEPLPDDGYYNEETSNTDDDYIGNLSSSPDSIATDVYDKTYGDVYEEPAYDIQNSWAPESDEVSDSTFNGNVEEIKTDAAGAMNNAYMALNGLRESLEEERTRRVNEMHRLAAELAGEDFVPISTVSPAAEPVSVSDPIIIESDNPGEVASALRNELDTLSETAEDITLELNDYDRFITESRKQQQELVDTLDAGGDRDAVVAGLINMYQQQSECTEQINTLLKKEQVLKNNAIEQRDKAYQTINEQKNELDKLCRSLRFSEKNKQKSEQFVKDAKKEIHATVQKARGKVEEAIAACERMQEQVNEAEARANSADERRSAAELARIEAYRVRDEALQELAEEKKNSEALLEACDRQLNEFINESINKIQVQIERANTAEQTASAASARISELESELAETRTRLLGYESKCSKKEVDIEQLRKQYDNAESRVSDMTMQYQNADAARKETGRILSETEAELVRTRATVKKLSETLMAAKEAKDAAIAEKAAIIQQLTAQCQQQVAAALAERDNAVSSLTGSKEEALSANQQFIAAMSAAMSLPNGFGSRKKKIDAITDAYNSFVYATQSAEQTGEIQLQGYPAQIVSNPPAGFGMKPMPMDIRQAGQNIENGSYTGISAVEPSPMLGDEFVGLYVPEVADVRAPQQ